MNVITIILGIKMSKGGSLIIRDGRQYLLEFGLEMDNVWLRIDNQTITEYVTFFHSGNLPFHGILYIGGHESYKFIMLPQKLEFNNGFSGKKHITSL